MIFTENTAVSTVKSVTSQSADNTIKLDSLQTAIDNLNASVTALQTNLNNLSSKIDDKYLAQTNTLAAKVTAEVDALKASYANQVNTDSVISDDLQATTGNINTVNAAKVDTDNVIADNAAVTEGTIDTLSSTNVTVSNTATLYKAAVQYLTAVNATITNLDMDSLSCDSLETVSGIITTLSNQIANITRLNASMITVSDGGTWREPVGAPTNTELLKIVVPAYDGITNLIAEDDSFNISILNNTFVTFSHDGNMLYKIAFEDAPNIAQSYSHLDITDSFSFGVPTDIESIEFDYNNTEYKIAKDDLNQTIDSNLTIAYSDNTLTFTVSDATTLSDVIVYDTKSSGKNDVIILMTGSANYKELKLGESSYREAYSELVDKTNYKANISMKSGSVSAATILSADTEEISFKIVTELPENYTSNTLYIVQDDTSYFTQDGISLVKMGIALSDVTALKGKANGIASLDSEGHIPVEQMPVSALIYQGQYDASTGVTPTQTTYVTGDFYIISAEGTINGTKYYVNDWIIWNGTAWERSANSNSVVSVNGMKGEVTLKLADVATSGTDIKTINGNSLLGSGNITLADLGISIV